MANDAAAILDAERVRSAHVVGHSLGGLVALRMALSHRERVKSLALLCTFSGGKAAAPMTSRLFWLGLGTRVGTRGMRRRAFLKLVMPPGAITDAERMAERLSQLFGHDLADQPPVVKEQMKAMRAFDVLSRLGELAGLPTLVASAEFDPIAPPSLGRMAATGIPGARFIPLQGQNHIFFEHEPAAQRFFEEIRLFLKR